MSYRKIPYWLSAFFGWLAATGYAGMDEYHQMLTGGRTPLFQDVMLDSAGALTAVLLSWGFLVGKSEARKENKIIFLTATITKMQSIS